MVFKIAKIVYRLKFFVLFPISAVGLQLIIEGLLLL